MGAAVLEDLMHDWTADVLNFHSAMGVPVAPHPHFPDPNRVRLRIDLVTEEIAELLEAIEQGDLEGTADAIIDSIYVLLGMALEFGFDPRPVWAEVQRTNMAKVGGPKRADGKCMKPPDWVPPNIASVLKPIG